MIDRPSDGNAGVPAPRCWISRCASPRRRRAAGSTGHRRPPQARHGCARSTRDRLPAPEPGRRMPEALRRRALLLRPAAPCAPPSDYDCRDAQGARSGGTGRRPRRGVDQGVAPADPAPGRLVAEERLRPRQRPTREPPPALAVAHRTGRHVPDLARHGPPLPGGTNPVEPARGGRRRRRPAAVGPGPVPAAGRRVLRRPGDGHRRRRIRQDPDDGGAGGLRRPPPRHAAQGDRLHQRSRTRPPRRSGNARANACQASRWERSTSSRAGF